MKRMGALFPIVGLVFAVALFGCEGDEGPAGPPGPPGPPGGTSEFTYLGGQGQACLHCHATVVSTWEATGHQNAYDGLDAEDQENLYCLQCHTTGFDSEVAFGDTEIAPGNRGPDTDGYDDYFGVDTELAGERRTALEGVQCEACHGPMGPDFNGHRPIIGFGTGLVNGEQISLCDPCHETQLEEWGESGHSQAEGGDPVALADHFGRSSCDYCHTSEGFIRTFDPAFADYDFQGHYNLIGCVTCHDPHAGAETGGNEYQLRTLGAVEVAYSPGADPGEPSVPRMEGKGSGQICAQCHHARRNTANVQGQIADGYAHFGPHGSPQMDMYIGYGCYEIEGFEYDRTHSHQSISNACVKCHMVRETELHGSMQEHAFHNFEPNTGNCLPCHPGLTDFDFQGGQTAIMEKMDELAVALGYTDAADYEANFDSQADGVQAWEREAAYALTFVMSDGSHGAHNPDYAMDLLQNALDYVAAQKALASN